MCRITEDYPMIERDGTFVESRRKFFQEQYSIVQSDDAWHAYSRKIIDSTTKDWFHRLGQKCGPRLLNAGSGGRSYGISELMTHLDLFESRLARTQHRLIGNISRIPAENDSFDVVICVGSVINYADPLSAVREFSRVLRSGGLLIIEYERSASFEHFCRNGGSQACIRVKTFYGSVPTSLWVYGDEFIDGLLAASGFSRIEELRFHALSSVVLSATNSSKIASWFTPRDRYFAQHWPLKLFASNRILAVEKIAD
jgi:SAM-dependent methyltransferase